jgi:tetratricopeptide (TPR) repeat protein
MNLVSRFAVAAALAAAPLIAAAPLAAQALPAAVGKPLQQASSAARAGNNAAALAAVRQARAAASTPGERQKVAEMAAFIHTRAGQFAQAAAELESVGASPRQLAPLYYRARQYDKAIAAARKAGGSDMQTIIAQSYLQTGRSKEAAKVYEAMLRSNPNNQNALENLAAAQFKAGDKDAYMKTTERLIRVDPSPSRWRTLLLDLKKEQMSSDAKLALYHLMEATGNVTRAEDVQEFAKLAIVANQPGVAKGVLDRARAANALPAGDTQTTTRIGAAAQRAAAAQAGLARLPATPAGQLAAGNVHLGTGNFAAAATAFGRAATGPDADRARIFQGIAQVRGGQAAAGRATFNAIPAGSSVKDIANLWALYASTRRG